MLILKSILKFFNSCGDYWSHCWHHDGWGNYDVTPLGCKETLVQKLHKSHCCRCGKAKYRGSSL